MFKVVFEDTIQAVPRDAPMVIFTDNQRINWDKDEADLLPEIIGPNQAKRAIGDMPGGVHFRPYAHNSLLLLWECWHDHVQVADPPTLTPQQYFDSVFYPEICLRGLSQFLPGLEEYTKGSSTTSRRAAVDGGYYCKTPENLPLIGPVPNVSGAFICGALSGIGVMSCMGAGELLAQWVTRSSEMSVHAPTFLLARYDDSNYQRQIEDLIRIGKAGQI
jgi:glycine/D-amino acid oxidase-like deaminating enzyme